YLFYFRRVLPAIGRAVSKHRDAYTYLPESVLDFPDPDAFARRLEHARSSNVGYELLTGGICAVHYGTRQRARLPRRARRPRRAGARRPPRSGRQRAHRDRGPAAE